MDPIETPDTSVLETPVAAAAPATPAEEYADFSRIFDELSAAADVPKPKDTTTSPPAVNDAAATVEAPKVETPKAAVEPVDKPAEVKAPEVKAPETEVPPPAAEPTAEDWEAKWKAEHDKAVEYKTKVDEFTAATAAKLPAPEPAKPEPELYDADEKEFLEQYGKDWPEIVKGEQLRRRAEYRQVAQHIFAEINRVYGPVLERASATSEQVADNTLLGTVRDAHPDYDVKMYNELTAWATGLTGFKGKIAREVIATGEPEDVVDLIADFKRETGRSKPAAVPTPVAPKAVTPLSDAAKKAAKAMGVVESKRSAIAQAADPNDFDAAWDEAQANAK